MISAGCNNGLPSARRIGRGIVARSEQISRRCINSRGDYHPITVQRHYRWTRYTKQQYSPGRATISIRAIISLAQQVEADTPYRQYLSAHLRSSARRSLGFSGIGKLHLVYAREFTSLVPNRDIACTRGENIWRPPCLGNLSSIKRNLVKSRINLITSEYNRWKNCCTDVSRYSRSFD